MKHVSKSAVTLFALLISSAITFASERHEASGAYTKVTLPTLEHQDAQLKVFSLDGKEHDFTPAALEEIGSYSITTQTPWRTEAATFEGPLLADVLAATGLADANAIEVIAENDYAVIIERAVWEAVPIMIATRVNGAAHSRRERGPIQFIMDMEDFETTPVAAERHWVWMAAEIKPSTQ